MRRGSGSITAARMCWSATSAGGASNGDELRLIRLIHDRDAVRLELKNLRTRELVRMSLDQTGSFVEAQDPKSYSLKELVDMARVPRFLKIDSSETVDSLHVVFDDPNTSC